MTASILVVTPHAPFGELLRISLEDSSQYSVRLVQSSKEARAVSLRADFQLAIVDSDISGEPFVPLCMDLLNQHADMRLIVIPPENNPNHPALGGLMPHGYLSRPFYLPDLLDLVSRLLNERDNDLHRGSGVPAAAMLSMTLPPWLQETLTLTGYLKQELAGTQALAGIIGMNGPEPGFGSLRAAAGEMNDESAAELATVVFRYWNRGEKTDLMRFIRLAADKRDYLVYATPITGDLVLILVYDTGAPLSQIRPQTKELAQTLAGLPPDGYHSQYRTAQAGPPAAELPAAPASSAPASAAPASSAPAPQAALPEAAPAAALSTAAAEAAKRPPAAHEPNTEPKRPVLPGRVHPDADSEEDEDLEAFQEGPNIDLIDLSALLGAIPSPDPEVDRQAADEAPYEPAAANLSVPASPISSAAIMPTMPEGMSHWLHLNAGQPGDSAQMNTQAFKEILKKSTAAWGAAGIETDIDGASIETNGKDDVSEKNAAGSSGAAGEPYDSGTSGFNAAARPTDTLQRMDLVISEPEQPQAQPGPALSEPAVTGNETQQTAGEAASVFSAQNNAAQSMPAVEAAPQKAQPEAAPAHDPLDDTRPSGASPLIQSPIPLDLFTNSMNNPALSLLHYTCVLVPRSAQHFLSGELADQLAQWMAQLCTAFGWRLEGLTVRPEYLQWSIQVAPAVSPGSLVRILRQRTSQSICAAYPNLSAANPAIDFWAPGYLVVSGPQPPSAQLVREYIAQTRKRQGSGTHGGTPSGTPGQR